MSKHRLLLSKISKLAAQVKVLSQDKKNREDREAKEKDAHMAEVLARSYKWTLGQCGYPLA